MAPMRTTGAIVTAAAISMAVLSYLFSSNKPNLALLNKKKKKPRDGLIDAIGNTPLIHINSLTDATGCEALESGKLAQGGIVTEGSAGSTAISLATVAPAYGCKCHAVIPNDAAIEKSQIIESLGATVERVRPVSITHRDHFVNIARRRAIEANEAASKHRKADQMNGESLEQTIDYTTGGEKQSLALPHNFKGGFFADQFENLANFRAHYEGTGLEIWDQTGGILDAFVAAAGTGGTVAGVSRFLQEKNPNIKCFLIDPPSSGLFNKVTRGVMYTREEAEGQRLKNPFDTITEGIGINRLTQNFMMAKLDGAFRGTDLEAIEMSRFLLKNDGLFLGSSSAMNCVGAVRVAQSIGPGHTIVTILCDSGMRHLSKFCNAEYLSQHGLTPKATGLEFLGYQMSLCDLATRADVSCHFHPKSFEQAYAATFLQLSFVLNYGNYISVFLP
nr:cysteine synthase 2-like [Quercus suber]POF20646.1 cysteine synthase 2 [Quercus suber]